MGRALGEELLSGAERRWMGQRELGVIAGDLGIGLGRLVGTHGAPSDGTVFVDETRLAGAAHLVLRVSHTGCCFRRGGAAERCLPTRGRRCLSA